MTVHPNWLKTRVQKLIHGQLVWVDVLHPRGSGTYIAENSRFHFRGFGQPTQERALDMAGTLSRRRTWKASRDRKAIYWKWKQARDEAYARNDPQ